MHEPRNYLNLKNRSVFFHLPVSSVCLYTQRGTVLGGMEKNAKTDAFIACSYCIYDRCIFVWSFFCNGAVSLAGVL